MDSTDYYERYGNAYFEETVNLSMEDILEEFAEYLPEYANLDELKEHYQRGGLGDVKVKKFLNNVLQEELAPIRARRKEWEKDIPAVYEILHKGSIEAEKVAAQTLADVNNSMKINYFEDHALITEQAERFKAE